MSLASRRVAVTELLLLVSIELEKALQFICQWHSFAFEIIDEEWKKCRSSKTRATAISFGAHTNLWTQTQTRDELPMNHWKWFPWMVRRNASWRWAKLPTRKNRGVKYTSIYMRRRRVRCASILLVLLVPLDLHTRITLLFLPLSPTLSLSPSAPLAIVPMNLSPAAEITQSFSDWEPTFGAFDAINRPLSC